MSLGSWRRAMFALGAGLLLVGAAMMVGGGLHAGRQQYADAGGDVMTGIWIGTVGTLGVVAGVVLLKLAVMGPYPKRLRAQAPAEAQD